MGRRHLFGLATVALLSAGAGPLTPQSSVDDVLDAMQARGGDLQAFTADLTQTTIDMARGHDVTYRGHTWFQALKEGDARLHVVFDTKQKPRRDPQPSKKEYLLQDGWLTDRDFDIKNETRRQVVQPGQKLDLFQLGKGPFPLPIGQSRQSVLKEFTVTLQPPDKSDPAGTIHLSLKPKPQSPFARQFDTVDFWVDVAQRMPVKIDTVDAHKATEQVSELTQLKLNPPVGDADFKLPPLDESLPPAGRKWTTSDVAYGQ